MNSCYVCVVLLPIGLLATLLIPRLIRRGYYLLVPVYVGIVLACIGGLHREGFPPARSVPKDVLSASTAIYGYCYEACDYFGIMDETKRDARRQAPSP